MWLYMAALGPGYTAYATFGILVTLPRMLLMLGP